MKHMFTGDPWYNVKMQGGVQGMGFRPGGGQVGMVQPLQAAQPTFGFPSPVQSFSNVQAPRQQQNYSYGNNPMPAPSQIDNRKMQQGPKGDCPVCRKFGSR